MVSDALFAPIVIAGEKEEASTSEREMKKKEKEAECSSGYDCLYYERRACVCVFTEKAKYISRSIRFPRGPEDWAQLTNQPQFILPPSATERKVNNGCLLALLPLLPYLISPEEEDEHLRLPGTSIQYNRYRYEAGYPTAWRAGFLVE